MDECSNKKNSNYVLQPHLAQKPVLRGEVGARALRVRSVERGGMGERGCERHLGGCGCEAGYGMLWSQEHICCGAPPQGLWKAPHGPGIFWKQLMVRLKFC